MHSLGHKILISGALIMEIKMNEDFPGWKDKQ
jgi:hypothetical protein